MNDMNEPSILDYLKSRLNPWQKEKIEIPDAPDVDGQSTSQAAEFLPGFVTGESAEYVAMRPARVPWRILCALLLGVAAQLMLEPPVASIPISLGLYFFALGFLLWSYFSHEFVFSAPDEVSSRIDPQTYNRDMLLGAVLFALAAFFLFSGNLFTEINVTLWLIALGLFVRGLWLNNPKKTSYIRGFGDFLRKDPWQISISRWTMLLVGLVLVIVFFRFYRLDGVPGQPFSDHAEKLLDVYDITQGQTHIFFQRNTGREFFQFYWTAAIATIFGTGLTFTSLKLGTALIGFFTLPYIYLLGKEIGGKRVALFALALAGTSYWLNTISRIGLRFPLYPAFAAPALFYLIRGLRRQQRNDFILSGLFLGLGMHGYSPFRFVPFVILLGVGLYLLHKQSAGNRKQTLMMLTILVMASVLVFLPLLRYSLEDPSGFSVRAMSRLTGDGQPLPAPAWQIFLQNTFNAMSMFNYDDGEIWVHSIPHRPALDIVSAVLFVFGYLILLVRYLRRRDWLDLFLFLSVPMLLMPSILSLAFPGENPSLNRTGAAAVVVFVIAGLALDGIYQGLRGAAGFVQRRGLAFGVVILLLLVSGMQSYNLVFDQFSTQFLRGAWNTSDIGNVIRSFVAAGNSADNAFVIPYPYWVDTRLVGIQAGYPTKDYALSRNALSSPQVLPGSKLFVFKEEDRETMQALKNLYPSGMLGHFTTDLLEGKNFWIYTVPDNQMVNP